MQAPFYDAGIAGSPLCSCTKQTLKWLNLGHTSLFSSYSTIYIPATRNLLLACSHQPIPHSHDSKIKLTFSCSSSLQRFYRYQQFLRIKKIFTVHIHALYSFNSLSFQYTYTYSKVKMNHSYYNIFIFTRCYGRVKSYIAICRK